MRLKYDSPEARDAFIEWYEQGENNDINGRHIEPEDHPDIRAIVDYFNNTVAHGPAVEVTDDEI